MGYYRKKVLLGKTTIILLGFQGNIITAIFMDSFMENYSSQHGLSFTILAGPFLPILNFIQ